MISHMEPQINEFSKNGNDCRILIEQVQNKTQVHAYLLSGEKGVGKRTLARLVGASLLCTSDGQRPCGICKNCKMSRSGEHPDVIVIEKGAPIASNVRKDRSTIPVDDIREMIRLCSVRSPEGNLHIVLIFDADKMTAQAQNCLLKTLEEPPEKTFLMLVTEHPESLLPTIISRCRNVRFRPWNDEYINNVLSKSGFPDKKIKEIIPEAWGSIGRALDLSSDESYWKLREEILKVFFQTFQRSEILKISNEWKDKKNDAEKILQILESYVRMMLYTRLKQKDHEYLHDFPIQWQTFAQRSEIERFIYLLNAIAESRKQLQYSVNFQAVFEQLLFIFMGEGSKWQK